ncbi:MAG: group II intron maturase-specific domain-containing protein, partial [Planctomycetota bacterium]
MNRQSRVHGSRRVAPCDANAVPPSILYFAPWRLCERSLPKSTATLLHSVAPSFSDGCHSLQFIIADVNRVLRGWFAYFKHSRPFVLGPLDRWVR